MSTPAPSSAKLKRFSVLGVCVIAALMLMPYLVGKPDGDKAPDIVRFIGRFHPLMLHLPIGVVALALLQEAVALFSRGRIKTGAGELMLGFAAASSVVAVIFGFLLYQGGGWEESQLAQRHMWGGIFFACAMIVTFLVKVWSNTHEGRRAWIPGAALFASSALMGLASHDGGSLTHGENYLVETAPAPIRKMLGVKEASKSGDSAHATGGSPDQQVVYTAVIAPLMEKRCNVCHNADKAKGKLRLDTLEWMVKGGKGGPAVVPGDLQKSLLLSCIALPKEDKKHMPPAEKPQIEAHELAVLQWWVTNGADAKKTVAEMKPSAEIKAALAKLTGDAMDSSKASAPRKVIALDDALKTKVADVAKAIPGALTFECQQSGALVFSAVAMRKTLGDPEFQKLTPVLKQLVSVDLTSTKVTDRGVATLSGAENLRMVRLGETGVTDAALDTLGKLKSLESVSLYGTAVTDAGVNKLASLSNLKHLYLAGTKVTPNALNELKKKLPQCRIETGI